MTITRPPHAPRRPHTLGVIGAGRVGRAVTAAVVTAGLVSTVLVYSRRSVEAAALAADAVDLAATQGAPTRIEAAEQVGDLHTATALVVCARARFANHDRDRHAGLLPNAPLIAALADQLEGFSGAVVMVTNPVDVMSRIFAVRSGAAVFGVGSNLDSARYRTLIAAHLGVDIAAVTGSVLGEHGPGATLCAHATRVHGKPIELPWQQLRDQLHARSPAIAAGLDRTQHGPAGAVLSTLAKLLGHADGHEELSVATDSGGVYLGHRLRFAAGHGVIDQPELCAIERADLQRAQRKLAVLYHHAQLHL